MTDRQTPPHIRPVRDICWHPPEDYRLSNGNRLFLIRDSFLEAVRLDIIFPGGSWIEPQPLICSTAIDTLKEGTLSRDAETIAEQFEYYGSYILAYSTRDYAGISLYSLTKYIPDVLDILEDIINNPLFPEKEVDTYLKKQQQAFIIQSEKVSYQSMTVFLEQIFGSSHPYGLKILPSHYDEVTPEDLRRFHKNNLTCNRCFLILTGQITDDLLKEIDTRFGTASITHNEYPIMQKKYKPILSSLSGTQKIILRKNAIQSAITVGKRAITRNHEDYPALSFVTTLLGGYFGSRLMKNIREEKGYTYGISSTLQSMRNEGYMSIQTEVGTKVCRPALEEIYREIRALKDSPPGTEEITLVRNYMIGSLMQSLDGALSRADMVKALATTNTDMGYPNRFAQEIDTISRDKIRHITEKYFDTDTLIEVVAGIC